MNTRQALLGLFMVPLFACGSPDEMMNSDDVSGMDNQLQMPSGSLGGPAGGDASAKATGSTTKVSYTVDATTIFANPERGFYHHEETDGSDRLSQSELTGFRTSDGVSLILRLFYLNAFRTGSISASYLDGMRTDFARIRAAGLKAVVRFAYTDDMSAPADATKAQTLAHIAQLAPILAANADIIATVQIGFVGAWGEWYYTDHFGDQGSISTSQWSDRKAVVDALLAALPPSRTVQIRTPAYKQKLYGTGAITTSEAFGPTARARIGHHNDCFLASSDDEGTYNNVSADKSFLATENLYVPQGGETCATSSYSGFTNAAADMEKLHYSFLNRDYLGDVYNSWGSKNVDVARRRLGYRLAILDGTYATSARPGGEFAVTLHVRNDGYAPPFNPRGFEVHAKNSKTGARIVAKLATDPRRFTPGATQTIDAKLCLPAGTPTGTYALYLALPDPEPTLHDRPEYAIRLANTGIWDATTGTHDLQQNIVVSASGGTASCSSGSVAFSL